MDKHDLSERHICTKFIAPAIQAAWWQQALVCAEMLDAPDEDAHAPDVLLEKYKALLGQIQETANCLKSERTAALAHHFDTPEAHA